MESRTVDKVAEHHTGSDEHLKHTGDTSSDLLRGTLGYICRGDGRDGAHAKTSDDATRVDIAQST